MSIEKLQQDVQAMIGEVEQRKFQTDLDNNAVTYIHLSDALDHLKQAQDCLDQVSAGSPTNTTSCE